MNTVCPECDARVPLTDDVATGEIVQCPDCAVELEVRTLNPVSVDLAPAEEEDWGE